MSLPVTLHPGWKYISFILAVSPRGLEGLQGFTGGIDSNRFSDFVQSLVHQPHFKQTLADRKLLLFLDNAPSHKSKNTLPIISGMKVNVIFMPPRNPFLNATEKAINYFKTKVKQEVQLGR